MKALLISCLSLFLAACAAVQPQAGIAVATGVRLVPPRVSVFDRTAEATQLVTARYGGRSFVFQDRIMMRPGAVRIAAFDPLGRTAVTIDWTAEGVRIWAAPWLPPQVRPENILADFILANAPEMTVNDALSASGAHLVSGPGRRSIVRGDRTLIQLEYQGGAPGQLEGRVIEHNLAWGYSLDIRSAAVR